MTEMVTFVAEYAYFATNIDSIHYYYTTLDNQTIACSYQNKIICMTHNNNITISDLPQTYSYSAATTHSSFHI